MSAVMKFGGTSVADPDAINRLIGIVSREKSPVVVVSALSKVTDTLVNVCSLAEDGDAGGAAQALAALVERHVSVASAVTTTSRAGVVASVKAEFDELIGL